MLKGQENLSIQTIAKLEEALDIDIIAGALASVSGYSVSYSENPVYLSEPDIPEYGSRWILHATQILLLNEMSVYMHYHGQKFSVVFSAENLHKICNIWK